VLGDVLALGAAVTTDLATDRRGAAVKHSGNGPLAHAAQQTDLDVGAFFETEFVVRHGDTVPERSGVALSFCGRPAINGKTFSFSTTGDQRSKTLEKQAPATPELTDD
jgi:hypothetical protein